jgi:hypothetical protein
MTSRRTSSGGRARPSSSRLGFLDIRVTGDINSAQRRGLLRLLRCPSTSCRLRWSQARRFDARLSRLRFGARLRARLDCTRVWVLVSLWQVMVQKRQVGGWVCEQYTSVGHICIHTSLLMHSRSWHVLYSAECAHTCYFPCGYLR